MSGKKGHCQTCDYIRSHRGGNRVNEDLVNGISIAAIMQRTGLGRATLTRHRDEGHMMKGYKSQAHLTKGAKEQLDLMKCQKKVWDDAQEAVDYALGRKDPPKEREINLAVFGQCIAPMTKIIEVLAKVEEKPQSITQNNSINVSDLSKLSVDQLRALKEMKTTINTDAND
jgi:hypothetical protein